MARHASTYRQARRAAWKESGLSWAEFNANEKLMNRDAAKRFGPVHDERIWPEPSRSKYIPHIGAKQRAKGAK